MDSHTRTEAHKLACPFHVKPTCRADECMGWQWYTGEHERVRTLPGRKPLGEGWERAGVTIDSDWIWRRPIESSKRTGFCRLCVPENARCVECLAPHTLGLSYTEEVK